MGRSKKRFVPIIMTAVIVLSVVVVYMVVRASASGGTPGLTIDGCEISGKEFLGCMESVEYDTKMWIQQEYEAVWGDDFWEKEYDGSYGYEILARRTVEQLQYIHAVYEIAEENGDVDDGSYEALERRWENENSSRSQKIENQEVVYGVKEYTFELYLQYEMSTLKETYCNDTSREGMELTEEEVQEHYKNGMWVFGEEGEQADLETARIAVERSLREQKYEDMVTQRAEDSKVEGDMKDASQFTLKNI